MKHYLSALLLMAALGLHTLPGQAQYPSRPVRIIVPFPAGGPTDSVARTIGQALAKSIAQPVIVENKPGADGAIAAQAVLNAPPDGYTLFFAVASAMVAVPLLQKTPSFDPVADFAPVSDIGQFAFCMYVHPAVPSKSVAEFVAYARANPGRLNYATGSLGELIAAAQFMKATGVNMVHVPYKGSAQLMPDLIAGRVQVNFGPVFAALPHVKEGRVRAPACLSPARISAMPDVPTLKEAGVEGVSPPSWQAVFAPAKTSREIVERLSRDINLILQEPEVRAQLERQALRVEGSTPDALAAIVKDDLRTWQQFIRENGIAPQ